MHIEKNICDSLIGTLLELEHKNKDTINARLDLESLNIRKDMQLDRNTNKTKYFIPEAPYFLEKAKKRGFSQYLSDCTFPDGFCSNMASCANVENCKIT